MSIRMLLDNGQFAGRLPPEARCFACEKLERDLRAARERIYELEMKLQAQQLGMDHEQIQKSNQAR